MLNFNSRVWRHGLAHPFYVPAELRQVRNLLCEGRIAAAIDELSRYAALGSSDAAATLAYMCLRDPDLPQVDRESITRLCRESAHRSHAYSLYVIACVEYQKGNFKEYSRYLHRSARRQFPPAIGDLARALIETSGQSRNTNNLAMRCLKRAVVRGHILSALYFLQACKKNRFGIGLAIVAEVIFPVALLLVTPLCRLCPFSASVFSHPFGIERPLFATLLSWSAAA